MQLLPDLHRSSLNALTNCYKEGAIPSLPIESKLWRKVRFETITIQVGNEAMRPGKCAAPIATINIINQLHRSPNETTATSSGKQTTWNKIDHDDVSIQI